MRWYGMWTWSISETSNHAISPGKLLMIVKLVLSSQRVYVYNIIIINNRGLLAYSYFTVFTFLSTMKWSVITKLTYIISLVISNEGVWLVGVVSLRM